VSEVVAVVASPRRNSNSAALTAAVLQPLLDAGVDCRTFDLSETPVAPCRGCLRCNESGRCVQDDFAGRELLPEMTSAAALVLAGPVYFMNISAQMKAVIDRHRAALHVTMKPDRIVCVPRVSTASRTAVLVFSQGEPQSPHWLDAARTLTRFVEEFYHGRVVATVVGAGLAMPGQVRWDARRLRRLAAAVGLPTDEAAVERMLHRNRRALEEADAAGRRLLSYLRPA